MSQFKRLQGDLAQSMCEMMRDEIATLEAAIVVAGCIENTHERLVAVGEYSRRKAWAVSRLAAWTRRTSQSND